jgi:hypothetical protein
MIAKFHELNLDDVKTVSGGVDRATALVVPNKTMTATPSLSTSFANSLSISRPTMDVSQLTVAARRY